MRARKKATDNPEAERNLQQAASMNQELMLSAVRQHELVEDLEMLNVQLKAEMAERKLAEEALQKSAKGIENILESISDAFISMDDNLVLTYFNSAAERVLNRKKAEVLGKNIFDAFPEVRGSIFDQTYHQAVKEKKSKSIEVYFDAVPYRNWYDLRIYPQDNGISVYFRVITEQKKEESVMQARLRLSMTADTMSLDEMLQKALDEIEALTQSKIGFYHFVEADQETLSLQHWSTNTLNNMCTAEGKGSHYPVSMAGVWADCLRERRPVVHNDYASLPNRKELPPGHTQVIREMVVPINRGDRTVAIIGVGNKPADYNEADIELASLLGDFTWEIVERKRVEDALSSSELRYRRLFESAGDGILLLDADNGTVYDVNPYLMEMLGYSHEEMAGKELWEIGPVKDIETAKDAFKELLKKEQVHYENLPLKTSDGRIIEVEVISSVYMVNQTRVIQCRIRDITERKALERLKADFYAMITHDIRSPLTVISGYSDILKSKADRLDAETNGMLAAIMDSGEKIEKLIENLLLISKMKAGSHIINPVPTDIAKLLRDSCLEIEMVLQKKKLDLKTEIADDLPAAMVDSRLIQRAVMNLLHNAVNYTPARGTITLEAELEDNDYIMISVKDTGEGIPADERQSIFEKYYRSEKTAGVKGSGLGLAIVKGAAEAHGGRVEVESEVGKGSTFKLFIPLNLKSEEAA